MANDLNVSDLLHYADRVIDTEKRFSSLIEESLTAFQQARKAWKLAVSSGNATVRLTTNYPALLDNLQSRRHVLPDGTVAWELTALPPLVWEAVPDKLRKRIRQHCDISEIEGGWRRVLSDACAQTMDKVQKWLEKLTGDETNETIEEQYHQALQKLIFWTLRVFVMSHKRRDNSPCMTTEVRPLTNLLCSLEIEDESCLSNAGDSLLADVAISESWLQWQMDWVVKCIDLFDHLHKLRFTEEHMEGPIEAKTIPLERILIDCNQSATDEIATIRQIGRELVDMLGAVQIAIEPSAPAECGDHSETTSAEESPSVLEIVEQEEVDVAKVDQSTDDKWAKIQNRIERADAMLLDLIGEGSE